ncbi:hypothetical protein [Tunturiibacter lichenicola]|uniref:hypothetical protein n=1 Tax=Tunturiibacter lichenicola TaxID=2051959 RepID=UPI003D9B5580
MIAISVQNGEAGTDVYVTVTDANVQAPGGVTNLGMIHPGLSVPSNVQEDLNGRFSITTVTTAANDGARVKNGGPFIGSAGDVVTVDLFGV